MTETRHSIEFLSRAVRSGNPYEETVQRLLQSIRLGVIEPGERLPAERELSAMLGVSVSRTQQPGHCAVSIRRLPSWIRCLRPGTFQNSKASASGGGSASG